ncbi:MAG: DUF6220 domain-containing protein, partial [Chloroflexota bacterium]
ADVSFSTMGTMMRRDEASNAGEAGTTASSPRPAGPAGPASRPPASVQWARRGYAALAWIFVGCLVVQVFLAGLGVFAGPANWRWHTTFVHFFELLPLLMLALAFLGRLPGRLRWLTAGLFALIFVQYATANLGDAPSIQIVAALHPVVALILFWGAIVVAQRAQRLAAIQMSPISR